ncbi:MAG TPA: glycosyltransferase [Acidimicrobiales bacterium]|nr:glycosyltransferase [Acidimicrobiales bacterium]
MRDLAILSLHTSPLAQPGTGDGGGMNVYVREMAAALARSGVRCEVFTRASGPDCAATVSVEPGFRVHHVPAGPLGPLAKEDLPEVVDEWTDGVRARLAALADAGRPVEAIHANYWLSGVAGHRLKHDLEVPLASTFHTLDRVKAEASPEELRASAPARRSRAEAEVIGCSDVVLASCSVEAEQLVDLYGADPERIEIVAPAVDHAFFAPGDRAQARRAIAFPAGDPMVLFVGRIQPLKGLATAVEALARVVASSADDRLRRATLVAIGGPSGPQGPAEVARVERLVASLGLAGRVRFVPAQPHEMLSTYYRAADVCVVPSRSESFGLVALEAAACGTPVVASAVGGLTTLVDDGRTGYLLDPHDVGAWADHLRLLLGSPARLRPLGRAAALRAGAYTWARAASVLHQRLDRVTAASLVACR